MSGFIASRIGKLVAAVCIAFASMQLFAAPWNGIVVDANGAAMGPYYLSIGPDFGSRAGVLLNLGGQPVLLPLQPGRSNADPVGLLPAENEKAVYFESTDCSGQAWLPASRSSVPGTSEAAVSKAQGVVVVYVPSRDAPESRIAKSHLRTAVCKKGSKKMQARRVDQIVDLSSSYLAPYFVQ